MHRAVSQDSHISRPSAALPHLTEICLYSTACLACNADQLLLTRGQDSSFIADTRCVNDIDCFLDNVSLCKTTCSTLLATTTIQDSYSLLIAQTSMMPGGTEGSVAAATKALATASTLTGGVAASPTRGKLDRFFAGSTLSALSSGTPAPHNSGMLSNLHSLYVRCRAMAA